MSEVLRSELFFDMILSQIRNMGIGKKLDKGAIQ